MEREDRAERLKNLVATRKDLEAQAEALKVKLEQVEVDIDKTRVDAEIKTLMRIIGHINPQAVNLPDFQRERFIKCWIAGDSEGMAAIIDRNNKQHGPREQGLTITHTEHFEAPEPVGPRCIERTVHVFGEGEQKLPV